MTPQLSLSHNYNRSLSQLHKNTHFHIAYTKPIIIIATITSSSMLIKIRYQKSCSLNSDPSTIFMATSISVTALHKPLFSSIHGGRGALTCGENSEMLIKSVPEAVRVAKPVRFRPMMKNVNEGKGVFAPVVVVARNIIGKKRFNQLRGKAIALHSQVITEFCKSIGADAKQRQGLIRLAKKNGERLGFLA